MLFLLSVHTMFSQTWNNRYSDDLDNTAITCRNIDRISDGYALLLTEQLFFEENNINYYIWNLAYYKINDDGELLFRKYYSDSSQFTGLGWANETFVDSENNIWAAGTYNNRVDDIDSLMGRLIKFSPEGDTLWTRLYGDSIHDHGLYTIRPTHDGNLVVQGMAVFNTTDADNWVMKLDTSGNVIWSSYFGPGTKYRLSVNVAESDDQQEFWIGGYEDVEDYEPAPKIWVLNADGQYIGAQNYELGEYNNSTAEGLMPDGQGNFYWCGSIVHEFSGSNPKGRHLLVKLDSEMDTIWTREIGPDYLMYNFHTHTIIPTTDGNFLCVGTTGRYQEFDSNSQGFMAKFSSEGEVMWTRYYEPSVLAENLFYDVVEAPEGGYVAAGETVSVDPDDERFTEKDAWVVKTDEYGCVVPGCQVDILEQNEEANFMVYPNPANGTTNIYLQSKDPMLHGILVINDMSGREIKRHTTWGGNINFGLDVSDFASGVYTISFSVDDKVLKVEKLVVQHDY